MGIQPAVWSAMGMGLVHFFSLATTQDNHWIEPNCPLVTVIDTSMSSSHRLPLFWLWVGSLWFGPFPVHVIARNGPKVNLPAVTLLQVGISDIVKWFNK